MSFLYPRTVSLRRPNAAAAVGAIGYGGLQPMDETVVAAGLPASIQYRTTGKNIEAGLPSDSDGRGLWLVYLPKSVPANTVRKNDVVVDDWGNRYQVTGAYWNSMGWRLSAELMVT